MQCRYCQTELEDGNNVCPNCGEINEEKDISKKLKVMKILTFCLAGVILVGALLGAINYGLTGRILPGKNDVYYKASYSVSEKTLETKLGKNNFLKNRDTVIATVGENTLTNAMLQVYYWDLVANNKYADMDSKIPLDQQYQDPETQTTWQQFYIEKAIDAWKRDVLVLQMAKENNFEMPEVYASQFETLEKDMLSTAISKKYTSLEAFLESMLGSGTTFQTYYDYLWTYFLGGTYWAEYIKTVEVDMTEVEAYYEAHKSELVIDDYFQVTKDSGKLVDVRHILIKPKGGTKSEDGKTTVYSEEEWNTCRDEAQAILDSWLAGEHTEESFAKLATEKTEDGGSKSSGGLYTDTWKGKMVKEFEDWCFDESRKTGDYGLVKTSYGYHVMYFVDAEEGWIRTCTSGAKSQKASEMIDELAKNTPVDVNYKKISLAELK
ncbi:MAG: peptidylprolyl isomerase [Oscillospiraceae bacterium]|nr:peptidylprolyl isomerase [Oscillospiraceae bacterium]